MKIAITGATGFVGSHLSSALEAENHTVIKLGRNDLQSGIPSLAEQLQNCEVVINLAGENISHRWTADYMEALYNSRIMTTRTLVSAMKQVDKRPSLFISTSAIGAFDSNGTYSEYDNPNATDFMGNLARDWETEARQAVDLGIRTLIFRLGLVLGRDGGMMKQLLFPFRLGLGGTIGDGSQHFSWIHIKDLLQAYLFALSHPEMDGVYHLCAPDSATNRIFTKQLGKQLKRPTPFPVPKLFLKLMFGKGG